MSKHLAVRLKAHRDHIDRVTKSRAKMVASNAKMLAKKAESSSAALQKARARFLPPGTEISFQVMNLDLWPYAGSEKVAYYITPITKQEILSQDVLCVWCKQAPSTTIDHVHPLGRGGSNHILNLVGSCSPCNSIKADFMPKELGWIMHHPQRAYPLAILISHLV